MTQLSKLRNGRDRDIEMILDAGLPSISSFTQVPNAVLGNPALSVSARLAYALLLKYAWSADEGRPAPDRLSADMRLEEKDVRRCLEELATINLLEIEQRSSGGADRHRLNFPATEGRTIR
jgi:hypothetical protein